MKSILSGATIGLSIVMAMAIFGVFETLFVGGITALVLQWIEDDRKKFYEREAMWHAIEDLSRRVDSK